VGYKDNGVPMMEHCGLGRVGGEVSYSVAEVTTSIGGIE